MRETLDGSIYGLILLFIGFLHASQHFNDNIHNFNFFSTEFQCFWKCVRRSNVSEFSIALYKLQKATDMLIYLF